MNILRYTHIFYFVFTWIYALIFIKPKRMKELFPVAVISMMILFLVDKYIISLGLYQFNNPVVNILDTPLFHILWAGAAGMIFIHYMKPEFGKKVITVIFFTVITLILEFISEKAGVATRLGNYNILHSTFLDFATLVVILWISEGLYRERIYRET